MASKVTTVDDLARVADIRDVQFYEISGVLYSGGKADEARGESGSQEVNFKIRLGSSFLAFRVRLEVFGEYGRYLADAAVIFKIREPIDPVKPKVMQKFIEREAFPVLYPFVRQAIFDVAARLGPEVPILGLFRVDGFDLRLQDATDEYVSSPD